MGISIMNLPKKIEFPDNKINYYDLGEKEIASFGERKPRLLMHVCCGPCSCFPLTYLCPHFDVTLYYGNSNIYPEEEFYRRRGELEKLLVELKKDYGFEVKLIMPPYDNEAYMKDLEPYKDDPECGYRCQLCYRKRMEEAYDYAEEQGYEYFCTVMTISRQKSSQILNLIGSDLEKSHPKTKYFYSDFKKKDGIAKGKAMREQYGLYNQTYCGCRYSYEKRMEYEALKTKN